MQRLEKSLEAWSRKRCIDIYRMVLDGRNKWQKNGTVSFFVIWEQVKDLFSESDDNNKFVKGYFYKKLYHYNYNTGKLICTA